MNLSIYNKIKMEKIAYKEFGKTSLLKMKMKEEIISHGKDQENPTIHRNIRELHSCDS